MTEGVTHQKNSIHSRLLAWRGTILFYKDQRQSLIARSFRWPDLQASFFRHGMNIVCKVKLVFGSTGSLGWIRGYIEEGFSSKTALLCGDVCAFVCFCVQEKVKPRKCLSEWHFFFSPKQELLFYSSNTTSGCFFFFPLRCEAIMCKFLFQAKKQDKNIPKIGSTLHLIVRIIKEAEHNRSFGVHSRGGRCNS